MIAVDTNVLLRYILNDHEEQFAAASQFFMSRTEENPAFVSQIVLCELAWSLGRRYGFSCSDVLSVISKLIETAEIQVEDEGSISSLISDTSPAVDFADIIIAYRAKMSGCEATVTFDQKAAARISGMELLT